MLLYYAASESDGGRTVSSIARREMQVSAALLRRMKNAGAITASGRPVFTNYRVLPGETIVLDVAAAEPDCDIVPENGELRILFENEGLIAVDKPSGQIVHPSRSRFTGTASNYVAGYLAKTGQSAVCHAVNRLDRDTSGVVLFAKNSHMKARAAFALESAVKEYIALAHGLTPKSGRIDVPIRRLEQGNMLRVASADGQRAVTHFETVQVTEKAGFSASLLRLRLETGRTHQIRVHLLHIGHPLLGDALYGTEGSRLASAAFGIETQALHACSLTFTEPLSGRRLEISAPAPKVIAQAQSR